jgi:hypothetical protein
MTLEHNTGEYTDRSPDSIGQKAHNLYLLEKLSKGLGFKVPPFRVVPVGSQLTDEQLAEIYNSLEKPLVVRSSSPYEDGETASFAGIFGSYLHIYHLSAFQEAVAKVQASAMSSKALEYAHQHNIQLENRMAVIVQEMIKPRFAGVCYSIGNPDDTRTVVEYNYGLADTLLSGDVPGTIYEYRPDDDLAKTDDIWEWPTLKKIAEITENLEEIYGQRLDVEFAVPDGGFVVYLVQAKPAVDPDWPETTIPDIYSPRVCFESDVVRGAGSFTGPVFVYRNYQNMIGDISNRNKSSSMKMQKQLQELKRFNTAHPQGWVLIADDLSNHAEIMAGGKLTNLRAVATVGYASRFYPVKIVSETGAFYIGIQGKEQWLYRIKTGDTLSVVSDQTRGVVYDLNSQ